MWGAMDNLSAKLKPKSFSSKKLPETRIIALHAKSLFQKYPMKPNSISIRQKS